MPKKESFLRGSSTAATGRCVTLNTKHAEFSSAVCARATAPCRAHSCSRACYSHVRMRVANWAPRMRQARRTSTLLSPRGFGWPLPLQESGEESDEKEVVEPATVKPAPRANVYAGQRGLPARADDLHHPRRARQPWIPRATTPRADGRVNPNARSRAPAERDRWPAHAERLRERGNIKPPAASLDTSGRSGSRDRAKSREGSQSADEGLKRSTDAKIRSIGNPAQLRELQDIITIDTVCVSAAKECAFDCLSCRSSGHVWLLRRWYPACLHILLCVLAFARRACRHTHLWPHHHASQTRPDQQTLTNMLARQAQTSGDRLNARTLRRSLTKMCALVKRGLKMLHAAWQDGQHDRHRASRLYQHPEWDSVRERLLEGLRAVHLVCTAGLVKSPDDFSVGVNTLQAACDLLPVRVRVHGDCIFNMTVLPFCCHDRRLAL